MRYRNVIYQLKSLFLLTVVHKVLQVSAQCSGSVKNLTVGYTTTTISPPGYPISYDRNLDCSWLVQTFIANAAILFRVTDITLSCAGDAINVYEGKSRAGNSIHINECMSGSIPRSLGFKATETGNVFTTFTSDSETSSFEKGFLMYLISAKDHSGTGCSHLQTINATEDEQYLTSPDFPKQYPTSTTCTWTITSNSSSYVYLELRFMDIENSGSCGFDYLEIKDSDKTIGKHCNENSWNPTGRYNSTGDSLTVIFHSDDLVTKHGFLLSYIQRGREDIKDNETTEVTTILSDFTTSQEESMDIETTKTTAILPPVTTSREDKMDNETTDVTTILSDFTTSQEKSMDIETTKTTAILPPVTTSQKDNMNRETTTATTILPSFTKNFPKLQSNTDAKSIYYTDVTFSYMTAVLCLLIAAILFFALVLLYAQISREKRNLGNYC